TFSFPFTKTAFGYYAGATAERQQYKEQQEEANCWQELKQQLVVYSSAELHTFLFSLQNSLQLEFVLFKLFYMDRKLGMAEMPYFCHCEKKIEKLRNQHSKAEKVHTASSLRVQQLEADLFNVEESMRDFEQKQILTMGIHLKQEQLEEYTRLKEEATAQTLFVDSELNQKKKILESFQEDLQRERTREEEILVTIRQREATISHYEHRLVQLQEEEQKTSREWKAARDKLARVKENHSLISMKVSSLFEQERLVEADLREAKADKHGWCTACGNYFMPSSNDHRCRKSSRGSVPACTGRPYATVSWRPRKAYGPLYPSQQQIQCCPSSRLRQEYGGEPSYLKSRMVIFPFLLHAERHCSTRSPDCSSMHPSSQRAAPLYSNISAP
ncbi:hypothetical protein Zmor_012391, partial [Zophobas morio]